MSKFLHWTDIEIGKAIFVALFFSFAWTFNKHNQAGLRNVVTFNTITPKPDSEIEKLWGQPERLIPLHQRKADSEIRYAAFGSSVTWGAGMENRENAYVWKLSPEHGDNYGLRANGPNYPASCINTMIEDKEYDVLILEFFTHQEEGMMTLARRLRERFPDAIIIILRQWYPQMLYNANLDMKLQDWLDQKGFGRDFIKDDSFHRAFIDSGTENWQFWQLFRESKIEYQEDTARQVQGYISLMPFNGDAEGPDGYLEVGRKFLAGDSFHQSEEGHANIALRVKEIVDRVGVPKNPRMGKFHDKDQCYNWLQTGTIADNGLTHSKTFQMLQMPNTEKFTLELSQDAEQGWISVINHVDHPMRLFVAYMTTSPAPYVYPLAEARIDEADYHVTLEPIAVGFPDKEVHIPRLADMGLVNPGESRVFFRTLEKAERPLRLVQVILTIDSQGNEALEGGNWLEEGKV